jgi:VanZ family protein
LSASRARLWKAWIPAAVWLGIIALESTNIGSSEHSFRFLYPIFHFLTGVDRVRFVEWNHYLRKLGHVVGYFVLSLLLFRAWRATLPLAGSAVWSMQWARISFFMTVLVASLDEWHQSYLPSRTGRWQDVALDSAAGLLAQILLWMFLCRRPARPEFLR